MRDRKPPLDIHQSVTDTLIAAIEAGAGEWVMPWHRSGVLWIIPKNVEGHSYNGINVIGLMASAYLRGYNNPTWGTYKQWQAAGAQVKKGEKASLVVFYKQYEVDPKEDDPDDDGKRFAAKASYVFNVCQTEGYPLPEVPPPQPPFERIASVEAFFAATGAKIVIGGQDAFYDRGNDRIQMPDEHLFVGPEEQRREAFLATQCHELIHWTGAPHRLNRVKGKKFGDEAYSREELLAECGSAMLCAELGISPVLRKEHATYCAHWLKILKEDKKAIFSAAARASDAVRYLKGLQDRVEVSHAA